MFNIKKNSIIYYSYILLFIILLFAGLYYGRKFLIPFSLAGLFAMLLWPVSKFFERKGVPRAGAAGICVTILLIALVAFCFFFASQASSFSSQLPKLQSQLTQKQEQVESYLSEKLGINAKHLFPSGQGSGQNIKSNNSGNAASTQKDTSKTGSKSSDTTKQKKNKYKKTGGSSVNNQKYASRSNSDSTSRKDTLPSKGSGSETASNSGSGISMGSGGGTSLSSFMSNIFTTIKSIVMMTFKTVVGIIIILVYVFLMLLYRHIFLNFILKLSPDKEKGEVISKNVAKVSYEYLWGRFIIVGILAVINSVGLTLIGIDNAIFFGVLAALLDLIPYIGIIIGAGLPLLVALVTKSQMWPFFAVLGMFVFVQLLENYFLTPKIVGSKVRLNPLFTIMAVLIGGYVWGVGGMILFIPFLGMLKIVFDHVEPLHPYGYLIGDPGNRTEKK